MSGEDAEWIEITEGVWQNKRCSHVFKGKNGVAYDASGYVFWSWRERLLEPNEEGFPGMKRFKSYFTSNMSRKLITFPCLPPKPECIEVESFEVNKEGNEREPGSGRWKTIYPEAIVKESTKLKLAIEAIKERRLK